MVASSHQGAAASMVCIVGGSNAAAAAAINFVVVSCPSMYIWIDVVWQENSGDCLHPWGGTANCYSALEPALGLGNGSSPGEISGIPGSGCLESDELHS